MILLPWERLYGDAALASHAAIERDSLEGKSQLRISTTMLAALAVFMRPASGAEPGVRLLDNRVLRPPPDAQGAEC